MKDVFLMQSEGKEQVEKGSAQESLGLKKSGLKGFDSNSFYFENSPTGLHYVFI